MFLASSHFAARRIPKNIGLRYVEQDLQVSEDSTFILSSFALLLPPRVSNIHNPGIQRSIYYFLEFALCSREIISTLCGIYSFVLRILKCCFWRLVLWRKHCKIWIPNTLIDEHYIGWGKRQYVYLKSINDETRISLLHSLNAIQIFLAGTFASSARPKAQF